MRTSKRGRPKGARNKLTNEAKEAILLAFEKLGGVDRLVKWVNEDKANETAFFTKIFTKLLPRPPIDAAPGPATLPPVRGALILKEPKWAKELQRKGLLKAGVAEAATAVAKAARPGTTGPPLGGEVPRGDWESGP